MFSFSFHRRDLLVVYVKPHVQENESTYTERDKEQSSFVINGN